MDTTVQNLVDFLTYCMPEHVSSVPPVVHPEHDSVVLFGGVSIDVNDHPRLRSWRRREFQDEMRKIRGYLLKSSRSIS